jgi:hypothetical protein
VIGTATEEERGATEVMGLEVVDGGDGGVGIGHGHGVGGRAEGRRHGGPEARPHRQQRCDRAQESGDLVGGGQQRAGAVAAGQAELEGVLARAQRRALAVGALDLVAGFLHARGHVVQMGDGGLVLGVEPLLTGVETGDPGLEGGEVPLCAVGAGHSLLARVAEPVQLVVGRGRPGAQRVDLTVQARQALAPVGGGADQAGHAPFLLGGRLLRRTPRGDGLLERRAVRLDLARDRALLLA